MLQNLTFSCNIFLAHFVRKEFEQKAAILFVDETLEIFSRSNIKGILHPPLPPSPVCGINHT